MRSQWCLIEMDEQKEKVKNAKENFLLNEHNEVLVVSNNYTRNKFTSAARKSSSKPFKNRNCTLNNKSNRNDN